MSTEMAATATTLKLLQGSTEFFPALENALNQARIDIHFETYLFNVAAQGERIASALEQAADRKSTRLNSSHSQQSRMPSSA